MNPLNWAERVLELTPTRPSPSRGRAIVQASRLEIVGDEAVEQSDAEAGGALVVEVPGLVRPGHAGNVEMRPFDAALDEALEEDGGGDRAALARADILHVGDLRFDQFVVGLAERHPP